MISDFAAGTLKFYRQDFSLEKVVAPVSQFLNIHILLFTELMEAFVTDSARSTVQKFSESGKFIETFVGPSSFGNASY